jgi:hypothetical protein
MIEEAVSTSPAANLGVSGEKSRESGIPGNSGENPRDSGPVAGDSQSSQEDEELIQQEASDPHPRVRQSVQQDHPINNILGSMHRGITTRSRLANFVNITCLFLCWDLLGLKKHLGMLIR